MPTREVINYAGYPPGAQPYQVAGQPWGIQAPAGPTPPPSSYQGLGDFGGDPFGYTGGSLLTPWTQQFRAPAGSGNVVAPDLKPWSYADFRYDFRAPGSYTASQFEAPGKFTYRDMDAMSPFVAPTDEDVRNDSGFKARIGAGTEAIERSRAAAGTLRGGGTLRGLMDYGQRLGSEEYDKVYGRRSGEYDRRYAQARDLYTTNRGNAAENYDRNFRTQFDVHKANEDARLGAYQASSDVALRGGELGYNIATGTYDRNQANAEKAWQSQQEMARAAASAANAGSAQDYQRAMAEYQMAYDIFNNNQDRQWSRLTGMANLGYGAAGQQAGYAANRGGTLADLYTGGANARAAGTIGGANAWNAGITGAANTAMDLYAMSKYGQPNQPMMPGTPATLAVPSYRRY